MYNSKIIWCT